MFQARKCKSERSRQYLPKCVKPNTIRSSDIVQMFKRRWKEYKGTKTVVPEVWTDLLDREQEKIIIGMKVRNCNLRLLNTVTFDRLPAKHALAQRTCYIILGRVGESVVIKREKSSPPRPVLTLPAGRPGGLPHQADRYA